MIDDDKAGNWEREARDALIQSFDIDNRAYRLAGMILALLHEREALLKYISRSQSN
jgi:hypothetical protein